MEKYYAFYGTLRKGFYNFERCFTNETGKLLKGVEFIRTIKLGDQPFVMVDRGPYPMLLESKELYPLTLDIVKIYNPKIQYFIEIMEEGAGYYEKIIKIPLETDMIIACSIYIGAEETAKYYIKHHYPIIKSGDWAKKMPEQLTNEIIRKDLLYCTRSFSDGN